MKSVRLQQNVANLHYMFMSFESDKVCTMVQRNSDLLHIFQPMAVETSEFWLKYAKKIVILSDEFIFACGCPL